MFCPEVSGVGLGCPWRRSLVLTAQRCLSVQQSYFLEFWGLWAHLTPRPSASVCSFPHWGLCPAWGSLGTPWFQPLLTTNPAGWVAPGASEGPSILAGFEMRTWSFWAQPSRACSPSEGLLLSAPCLGCPGCALQLLPCASGHWGVLGL